MNSKEFVVFRDMIIGLYKEELAHNESLFADAKHENHSNIGCYHQAYMLEEESTSSCMEESSFGYVREVLDEFEEECKSIKNYPDFKVVMAMDADTDYDSNDIYNEEIYMKATWRAPRPYVEVTAKDLVRQAFAKEIAPDSKKKYPKIVDCKMMALFKDGTITFEALRKITYSDCDL